MKKTDKPMNMNFPKFLEYRSLAFRFQHDKIMDYAMDDAIESSDSVAGQRVVNICFKDSEGFSQNIEEMAKRLDLSKREFMKRAILHAMELADQALDDALEDWE